MTQSGFGPGKVVPITHDDDLDSLGDESVKEKPITATTIAGAAIINRRLENDRARKVLTKRDEDESVGDWLFGKGGIKGLGSVTCALRVAQSCHWRV